MPNEVRLQKMLSDCGVTSRRKAEVLIAAGKVQVNGRTAQIGDKVDAARDYVPSSCWRDTIKSELSK